MSGLFEQAQRAPEDIIARLTRDSGDEYATNPARSMPRRASGFFMNVSQTNPERAFSAITIVIPVSIPTTS
jgi:hypothetical protein